MNKVDMSKLIHNIYDNMVLYTIRIYSNNTKQESNMITYSSICVITILFNNLHHMHVILQNPTR